nr:hypothetical protein [uncultured Halomonas sp.]
MVWFQALLIVGLALVHVFAGRLRFLDVMPRSGWLSFAGGVSVAYVFIHVFPELEEAQRALGEHVGAIAFVEHHAYLVALAGLAFFYGLERLVKTDRGRRAGKASVGVFWLHIASFAFYNALVGYLLVYREDNVRGLLFFFLAMAFHFLVNDHGLRQHHRGLYGHTGRWVLAMAVIIGWGVGLMTEISEAATSALFAFLAGGIVLNVLKEELPEERLSRFWPFALGAIVYAVMLLVSA